MPIEDPGTTQQRRRSLRRAARSMVKVGLVLSVLSVIALLASTWATRSMIEHVRDNAAPLDGGTVAVSLHKGDVRGVYVTGGAVAPGEDLPTPVENIRCTVTGPKGKVPFSAHIDEGRKVGLDNPLARFQVVGRFTADSTGQFDVGCTGAGVSVAPEVAPASALLRVGALLLSALGAFTGLGMLAIGGLVALVARRTPDEVDDEQLDDEQLDDEQLDAKDWWDEDDEDGDNEPDEEFGEGFDGDLDDEADLADDDRRG